MIVVGVLVVAVAIVFVLQQRRTPQSAAASILFMLILPYVAIPLFLMLGFRKQGSRFPAIQFTNFDAGTVDAPAADLLRQMGAPQPTGGNTLTLLDTADTARAALDELINGAQETLDILFYIVAPDPVGERFVEKLTTKAKAGVKVRLNIDRLGTLRRPHRALDALRAAGGEVRYFSPFLHPPDNGHLNLRNHRKLVIADRARVWTGGRNVGAEYLGTGPDVWTDLSFTVTGPAVQPFIDVFASDWDVTGRAVSGDLHRAETTGGTAVLQVVPSGPDEPEDVLHDGLVTLIHRSRARVWVATPYFVPTEELQAALASAARRGVDVRLLLPDISNQRTADFARGPYLRELQAIGVKINRFTAGMLHAKAGLIDDVAWAGSANFDVRSLLLNFELALFCHDAPTVRQIEDWYLAKSKNCELGVSEASLPMRIVEGVFRLGAPVL